MRDRGHRGTLATVHDLPESLFVEAFESIPDLFCVVDPDARLAFCNHAWWEVLDHDPEDLAGRTPMELAHPDDLGRLLRAVSRREGGGLDGLECRVRHADGSYRSVLWSVWTQGLWTFALGKDVSRLAAARDRLRDAGRRLAESHAAAHVVTWEWDPAADRVLERSDLPGAQRPGRWVTGRLEDLLAHAPEPHRGRVLDAIAEVCRSPGRRTLRVPVRAGDATERWLDVTMWQARTTDGRIVVRASAQEAGTAHVDADPGARVPARRPTAAGPLRGRFGGR